MSSSDSIVMATKVESQPTCHFMRLPTEVREMIYRPLVIARYAMVEHRMKSREYDHNRRRIQNGPDQEYRFETAILATNRRIHEEVRDLCRRENDFVCLTSRRPSRLGSELVELGLQMIAKRSRARSFWNISMTVTLDSTNLSGWPRDGPWYTEDQREDPPEDGQPWKYIFCSEELPEFCRLFLDIFRYDNSSLKETVLYININSAIANGQGKQIDDHPAGRARMQKLLGPLRQLHSVGAAQIDGPLSGGYKGEIIRCICKHYPTAMDIVYETMACLEQADEQASKDQLRHANLGYKAALSLICSCCWRHQGWDFLMSDGPFPRLEVSKVVNNIVVRLQGRIASVYYKSNELRMARIYTERALDPRRPYDRLDKIYYTLDIEPWEHIVYAEVLHVAAMISYTHGNVHEAINSLSQARKYVPFDEEQKSRGEAWQAHADKLRAIHVEKAEARERRLEKQHEKAEAMIEVVCNWKRKGERLFRSGRSYLAVSVYQAALKKLGMLDRNYSLSFTIRAKSFQGYEAVDAIKVLAFRIEACLAVASLKSQHYKEVAAQTDAALKCEDETHTGIYPPHMYCSHSYRRWNGDWAEDQKPEYLTLHYCKAMALYHLGNRVTAIEHMEEALRLDPGDTNVFEKLTMLKQTLAEEAAARKQRLVKINKPQNQLRKKQARRRMRT